MSPAEVLAPFVALPVAAFFLWLPLWEFIAPKRRAAAFEEWRRDPVPQTILILANISLAVFLVWIGSYQMVGTGHAGWVSAACLVLGLGWRSVFKRAAPPSTPAARPPPK